MKIPFILKLQRILSKFEKKLFKMIKHEEFTILKEHTEKIVNEILKNFTDVEMILESEIWKMRHNYFPMCIEVDYDYNKLESTINTYYLKKDITIFNQLNKTKIPNLGIISIKVNDDYSTKCGFAGSHIYKFDEFINSHIEKYYKIVNHTLENI